MQTSILNTKPHYPILDGLRGVAAILVVIFHLFEAHFPDFSIHPIHHGYLAVDFFFLLSGFVVGYAYDDRWGKMSVWEFFKIRLVRLHPLVILGTLIGAIGFWFDPFTDGQSHTSFLKLLGVMIIGFTLLPSPDLRGWNETHSLDGPCWSLMQEYIANVIYGLFGRNMTKVILWIVVLVSGTALVVVASDRGDIATGWGYNTFWIAVVRMMFPFFAGLLLFRTGKLIRIPIAFTICSLMLVVVFCLPHFTYNGIYESAAIIVAFPMIVAAGAGGEIKGKFATKVCKFFGDISYPIYITHYPIIYIYSSWIWIKKPSPDQFLPITVGLFFLMILLAYLSLRLYDEPVRRWLKKKFLPS
jgi:peptidoglycan/LPS O-acetylase OafA/YrhL